MKKPPGSFFKPSLPRRDFLKYSASALALASSGLQLPVAAATERKTPETLVKVLYDSMNEKQRKAVCFDWNYIEPKRGLLRTRLENNWKITKPSIDSGFYTGEQKALMREIFLGMTHPAWHERYDKQLKDDVGGFGKRQSIAIFGKPGTDQFEFVLASRHMTLRCDGNSAEHVAFGGPILYAHDGEGTFEKPHHPSNVFWHQALAANKLYDMFDGKQRKQALVTNGMPSEELVGFRGPNGKFDGIPVTDFSADQKEHLQFVLKLLLEPFRQIERLDRETLVRGDEDDRGGRRLLRQPPRHLDTVESRHRKVEEHEIGRFPRDDIQRGLAMIGGPDHLDPVDSSAQGFQTLDRERFVVDQNDAKGRIIVHF